MKILFLTNHLNTGGITSYVYSLTAGLKKRGHQVYLASSGGECVEKFTKEGVVYFPIPIRTKSEVSLKILFSFFKLRTFVKKNEIDIVHANTRVTQVLSCLVNNNTGKPFISTCHGFFKKRFFRWLFPCWGQKVIAVSSQVKEHLIDDFKIRPEIIRVIHNGIDISGFREQRTEDGEQRKKELGLKDGPVVGIVARLSDVKGHIYLIRAMAKVLQSVPEAQLLIVGEGKMKNELVILAKKLGIENKIIFVSTVSDTNEVLSIMDVFVMPSLKEGLGLSLMEAMACGLAVVGSNIGGIKSLIQDGSNGLLVEPKDIAAIARAILTLLESPEKRKALGSNAKEFIVKNFSLEDMIAKTEGVYEECLNAKQ